MKSTVGAKSSRAEVEDAVGRYLRGAADRKGGRKRRSEADDCGRD